MKLIQRVSSLMNSIMNTVEARIGRATAAVLRITLGLLWLSNLHWKRPADFGRTQGNGLFKYVNSAVVDPPVFRPYSSLVEHVILPNFHLFGWFSLMTEALLAGALLVGWKTRWMALLGVVQSLAIGLSVINYSKAYEWPWSYYLMIAAHLALLGLGAGKVAGVDGLTRATAHRGWTTGGIVAALAGVWALIKMDGFNAPLGGLLGNTWGELKFMRFNGLGALVLLVIGGLALAAGQTKRRELGLAAAVLSALVVVLGIVQWRTTVTGVEDGGLLGIEGGAIGFSLGLTLLFGQSWWLGAVPAAADSPSSDMATGARANDSSAVGK